MSSRHVRQIIEMVEQDAPKDKILRELQYLLSGSERDEEESRRENQRSFEYTLKIAKEELQTWFKDEVKDYETDDLDFIDPYDAILDIADSSTPVYYVDIFACLADGRVYSRDDIEIERGKDLSQVAQAAIFEALREELQEEYDRLLEEEKERREEAEEESEDE